MAASRKRQSEAEGLPHYVLGRALLDWYGAHRRDLPWRRTRDPYAIWVSEVMLQQTQVTTVLSYYERWMQRFPDVRKLAAASHDDVLKLWQGLGYYSRAKRLLRGARAVVDRYDGRLPNTVDELRSLPGIGPYSAGAIASIAFNLPAPLVDGNVVRVLCRLFALRGDPTRAPLKARLWQLAESLIVPGDARNSNQALMELGATVCTPRDPNCRHCPVQRHCAAHQQGIVHELPELAKRGPSTKLRMIAALARKGERLLVVKLPDNAARWAGMWQFPSVAISNREKPEQAAARAVRTSIGLEVSVIGRAAVVRHSVTRFRITLTAYHCEQPKGRARAIGCADFAYKRVSEVARLALPAAQRRLLELVFT